MKGKKPARLATRLSPPFSAPSSLRLAGALPAARTSSSPSSRHSCGRHLSLRRILSGRVDAGAVTGRTQGIHPPSCSLGLKSENRFQGLPIYILGCVAPSPETGPNILAASFPGPPLAPTWPSYKLGKVYLLPGSVSVWGPSPPTAKPETRTRGVVYWIVMSGSRVREE